MASPNTRRNHDAEENDLYITPKDGLVAMEKFIKKEDVLFDPCAGLGDMADHFCNLGNIVLTNDVNNYNIPLTFEEDFLSFRWELRVDCVIMNPPYTLTSQFINKALTIADRVVMFNRLSILEGQKRGDKFSSREWPLKECDVFSYRVSCVKGRSREPTNNAVAYAVYEFDKNYKGEPTLGWISKLNLKG